MRYSVGFLQFSYKGLFPRQPQNQLFFLRIILESLLNNMAKRVAQAQQKLFSFDLESLLISDLSPEEQQDSQSSTSGPCKPPKVFKAKDGLVLPANKVQVAEPELENIQKEIKQGNEEVYDVTTFFENVGNDFSKSLQVRKSRLGQFTETVLSVYQSKTSELIKRQETELEDLKEQSMNKIEKELNKCEEEFKKLKQQENKLIKILEQQMKMVQKTAEAQKNWIEHFRELHQNFVQDFEELKNKHKSETLDLKKTLTAEVTELQNKFLMDSKKEEMQTVKKYLSSVYF